MMISTIQNVDVIKSVVSQYKPGPTSQMNSFIKEYDWSLFIESKFDIGFEL